MKVKLMNVIIILLVFINACIIIAMTENNTGSRLHSASVIMQCYADGDYGRAVDYTNRYKTASPAYANYAGDNEDINECIAVADYYMSELYKKAYMSTGDTAKANEMSDRSQLAIAHMGSLAPLKGEIDGILER